MPVAIPLSPDEQRQFQRRHRWSAAWKAALIAGAIVWLFPSGNPWTSFSQQSAAHIMGRPVSANPAATLLSLEALPAHAAHFAVSVVYGLILLPLVYRLRSWRAVVAGIVGALILYAVNFAIFRFVAPQFTGELEINVALAHALFGGMVAGAIRGLLRPPMRLDQNAPNPGPRYP